MCGAVVDGVDRSNYGILQRAVIPLRSFAKQVIVCSKAQSWRAEGSLSIPSDLNKTGINVFQ